MMPGKLLHQLFLPTFENTDVKNGYAHLQHPAMGFSYMLASGLRVLFYYVIRFRWDFFNRYMHVCCTADISAYTSY